MTKHCASLGTLEVSVVWRVVPDDSNRQRQDPSFQDRLRYLTTVKLSDFEFERWEAELVARMVTV